MRPRFEGLDSDGHPMPMSKCPVCGYEFDCASRADPDAADNDRPSPGDLSLCLKCGELLVFTPEMTCRQANIDDTITLEYKKFKLIEKAQKLIRKNRFLG